MANNTEHYELISINKAEATKNQAEHVRDKALHDLAAEQELVRLLKEKLRAAGLE